MPYPKIEKTDDPNVFTFRYFPSALDRNGNTAPSSGTVEHLGRPPLPCDSRQWERRNRRNGYRRCR